MSPVDPLPFRAILEEYEEQVAALLYLLESGDESAQWRVKWEHPRFRGKGLVGVKAASLDLADAQTVVAREYGFEDWSHLAAFADAVQDDEPIAGFETAVEAVIAGNLPTLRSLLREHPELIHARSARRHHATLLHYLAANGVEGHRQKTPTNALEVAETLLEAGADVDALADMYDEKCTTMSMLVSSTPPHEAGLQTALAEKLLDHGAALEGRGSKWQSALMTALVFGFQDTAEMLVRRGAPLNDVVAAAGLGRVDDTARLLPSADSLSRHAALALAVQYGHEEVVRLILDVGEDPNRYNPEGFHSHATPMHHAVSGNHANVVRLLADRGARLDIRDTIYQGTPLDWAVYLGRTGIAEDLRARGG